MLAFKTGRLPATRPAALADLEVYVAGKLPRPPAAVAVPSIAYPIDCNQEEGDCTIAGVDHLLRAWNALYPSAAATLPTEPQIRREYRKLTGGQDTGLNEANVLQTWQTVGVFGTRVRGYAPINPHNLLTIHQSIAFYGGCYLGILCPPSAQEQFANNQPWTYCGEETNDGHCIVALGYDDHGNLLCATWGGIATVTPGFLAHYLEEAWCVLGPQLLSKDTLGIDIATLQSDLRRLNAPAAPPLALAA